MIRACLTFPSTTLLRPVNIEIALPGGFSRAKPPFRCLWALHCAMADGKFFFDSLGLEELAEREEIAVVAPSLGNGYFMNSDYENQGDFMREMFKQLSSMFSISTKRSDNAVLGISMGGFGALSWALQSGAFVSATAISGIFDCHIPPDERLFKNRKQRALHAALEKNMRGMFLDHDGKTRQGADFEIMLSGSSDYYPQVNLYCGEEDYLSLTQTLAMRETCERHNCPVSLNLTSGSHDAGYWRSVLDKAVSTAYSPLMH